MKLLVLPGLFFCSGVLAAVINLQSEQIDDIASTVDVPVTKSPEAELSFLKQLSLKTHSSEEDRQHLWKRVKSCEGCHSYQMYTGNGYLPILQGQNLEYLFSKLLMFKNNRRSHHPLGRYLESLSSQDLMDISYFYAEQLSDLKRNLVSAKLSDQIDSSGVASIDGCAECHGVAGNGGQLIPAISGQNKNYLSYRIREIADEQSRVHFTSDAPLSCKITDVNVRQSRQLASLLSVVVDQQSVAQGEEVYRLKCVQCHGAEQDSEVSSAQATDWTRHLLQGTRLLVYKTQFGNQHKFIENRDVSFSLNEMKHAIHYMIDQLQRSL